MDPHAPAGAIRTDAAGLAAPLDADGVDEVLRLWLGCHLPPGAHADGRPARPRSRVDDRAAVTG